MTNRQTDAVPYPAGPILDDHIDRTRRLPRPALFFELLLLIGHVVFLLIYASLIAGLAYAAFVCWQQVDGSVAGVVTGLVGLCCLFAMGFAALVVVRKIPEAVPAAGVAISADSEPRFFGFLQRVCDDVGRDPPRQVVLTAEADTCVHIRPSLANLLLAPSYDLHLGIGLVNMLTLAEFQAVVAHELSHASPRGPLAVTSNAVEACIAHLLAGAAWISRLSNRVQNPVLKVIVRLVTLPSQLLQSLLDLLRQALLTARTDLIHEREFLADRIAAEIAGANNVQQALRRSQVARARLAAAQRGVLLAAEHGLVTTDLFFHQQAAVTVGDEHGHQATTDRLLAQRLQRLQSINLPAQTDERSPWLLFANPAELRREVTLRWLRSAARVPSGAKVQPPQTVQDFIDAEFGSMITELDQAGILEQRFLQLEATDVEKTVAGQLERGLQVGWPPRETIQRWQELSKLRTTLLKTIRDGGTPADLSRLTDIYGRLPRIEREFRNFDLSLLHGWISAAKSAGRLTDAVELCRLLVTLQDLGRGFCPHAERCLATISGAHQQDRSPSFHPSDDFVMMLRAARSAMVKILNHAERLHLPALSQLGFAIDLRTRLLNETVVADSPPGPIAPEWLAKFERQLEHVNRRLWRTHALCLRALMQLNSEMSGEHLPVERELASR